MKNMPENIILYLCTTNDDRMMHGSWNMECERQFLVILDYFFVHLPPQQLRKSKFWKKKGKKAWRYHFTQVHHKEKLYDIYVFMIYMIYDIYVFYQIQWKWSIFLWFTMFINSTWFWLLLPFPLGITKKFPF